VTQQDTDILELTSDQECAQFQAQMAVLIGDGEDLQGQPHLATCERCTALVRDLEAIAEAARMLLPIEEEPDDDVWVKLQKKLAMETSSSLELGEEATEPEVAEKPVHQSSDEGLGALAFEGGVA
jgi:hypothetical protein